MRLALQSDHETAITKQEFCHTRVPVQSSFSTVHEYQQDSWYRAKSTSCSLLFTHLLNNTQVRFNNAWYCLSHTFHFDGFIGEVIC